jgi:hypothetical protein
MIQPAIRFTVARPRPEPSIPRVLAFLMRTKSLNSLAASSRRRPKPVSRTEISNTSSCFAERDVHAAALAVVLDGVGQQVIEHDLDLGAYGDQG